MANATLVVSGIKELLQACTLAEAEARKQVRDALKESGEIVRADASKRLSAYSAKSAAGLKVRVRQRGVAVEQSLRKTTGPRARRNYPGIQMHILSTTLQDDEAKVAAQMEKALDTVGRVFNEA